IYTMCGILGFHSEYSEEKSAALLRQSVQTLSHRGPDYTGTYFHNKVYLAHTRLKIIDLSENSNQPLMYLDRVVVSFNGEIYNFETLKRELQQAGFVFKSLGDTEVIAAAYLHWGASFVNKLDGMFALSIYDIAENKILLARDIFGKKPLYYSTKNGFEFSSELNAFKTLHGSLKINPEAINHFLAIGYILNPLSPYCDIEMLPPSTILTYCLNTKQIKKETYFNYADCFRTKTPSKKQDIVSELKLLLEEAVKKRMIGDVPMGIFLSSG